jgi:hypothetical protein
MLATRDLRGLLRRPLLGSQQVRQADEDRCGDEHGDQVCSGSLVRYYEGAADAEAEKDRPERRGRVRTPQRRPRYKGRSRDKLMALWITSRVRMLYMNRAPTIPTIPSPICRAKLSSKLGPAGKALAVGVAVLAAEAGLSWLQRRIGTQERSSLPADRDTDSASRGYLVGQSLEEVLVQMWEDPHGRVLARREVRSFFTTRQTGRRR